MNKINVILIAAVLPLAGCISSPQNRMALSDGGEDRIQPSDMINVALMEGIPARKEPSENIFGGSFKRIQFETGHVWQRVFIGQSDAPARLEIVSTKIDEAISGAGFTCRFTYTVDAILHINGKTYPIHAIGSRSAAAMLDSARRQAIELGIVNTAREAAAIITAIKKE